MTIKKRRKQEQKTPSEAVSHNLGRRFLLFNVCQQNLTFQINIYRLFLAKLELLMDSVHSSLNML